MEEFINNYFSILNLKTMPEEILARLRGYIAKDSFPNDTVKYWKDNFMTPSGEWAALPTIDPNDPNKTPYIEELYITLFRAFKSMSRNQWAFNDNEKAITFVDTYFGAGKLFEPRPIPANTAQDIKDFINLFITDSDLSEYLSLDREDKKTLKSFLDGNTSIDDDKVKNIAYRVINDFKHQIFQLKQDGKQVPDIDAKLGRSINLQDIIDTLDNDEVVTDTDKTKLAAQYKDIFNTLYKNKSIRDIFTQYDTDKTVSNQIERALKLTDYTGKTNESTFIPPKYDDKLNLKQQIDKTLKDTYSDVLKKWHTAHRANIFIKPTSKAIFAALDKEKIAPTDGIKAILEKASNIENSLKGKEPFEAAKHFKWLTDRLSSYDKNGMSKALEGALRNGQQMRYVIEQIIKDAVPAGKIKEAKTAMEVLSVMQYGLFTSRTMDAVNKTDVNIFSDDKLSWNKNEGIQFVTKAFDKTMKFGIQATGYGITAAVNGLRRINRNFNHKPGGTLQNALDKDAKDKSDFEKDKITQDADNKKEISDAQAKQAATGITDITVARNNLDAAENNLKPLEEIETDYGNWDQAKVAKHTLETDIATLQAEIRALPYPAPDPMIADEIDSKTNELKSKQAELTKKNQFITAIEDKYLSAGKDIEAEHLRITTAAPGAQSLYDDAQDKYNDLQQKVTTYDDEQNKIDLAQKSLDDRQEILDNWDSNSKDLYTELMGYWDFLQSGNTKSLFHWSTKNLQKKMDSKTNPRNMQNIMQSWMQQHKYTA